MAVERAAQHFEGLRAEFGALRDPDGFVRRDLALPVRADTELTGRLALQLFESQLTSRCVDLAARWMRAEGKGYYTIASSGHEGNVVLGALAEPTDPWFLHYRSGAAVIERCGGRGGTPIFDLCLSLRAAASEPISGGRHKVFGNRDRWILPQTSTIASHLPKALGTAFAIDRGGVLDGVKLAVDDDAIALCNFGDASLNHSTAQGAINAARWARYQHVPLPLLLVCEDNGFGISLNTPGGWVEAAMGHGRGPLVYVAADGLDLPAAYDAAKRAIETCRLERRPVFLHLKTVRLFGHAGSDLEAAYRTPDEIRATEAQDPVRQTALLLLAQQVLRPSELCALMEETYARVFAAAAEAAERPQLQRAAEVMAPLPPLPAVKPHSSSISLPAGAVQEGESAGSELGTTHTERAYPLARLMNDALAETLQNQPNSLVFGEDVGGKGGVYGVTRGLQKRFGAKRVFSTLLDEQTILGLALGAAQIGLLPIPEIQYLAYLHNAEDQLRGEAASLSFFSGGQFTNPMVVRIASFGYQKGFGGHFHNDNSIAVLRDIPGLIIATPARGSDAVRMWRQSIALAQETGRVVAFLEPIARYHTRDLLAGGDGLWADVMPPVSEPTRIDEVGQGRCYLNGPNPPDAPSPDAPSSDDLTIVTYANGVYLSLQAAEILRRDHGISVRVFDLRWLAPMDVAGAARHVGETGGRVLVVDEGRKTGGVAEAIITGLVERGVVSSHMARLCGEDTFIPLGPAAELVMPSAETIVQAAVALVARPSSPKAVTAPDGGAR
ncbi:MAG: hypothetical protein KC502_20875 [Myxococcales bacterium]|nr:hypothetical protein [Myxococcales bacterium]